jgi:hypothetical protein
VFSEVRAGAVVRQQRGEQIFVTKNPDRTTEELYFLLVRAEMLNRDGLGKLVSYKSA